MAEEGHTYGDQGSCLGKKWQELELEGNSESGKQA